MPASESNKAAIAANRKTIFNIESNVLSNKALVYQSRSMIEENRLMIMSNYSAAFMGNRQLANANTDEIFANRSAILGAMDADGPCTGKLYSGANKQVFFRLSCAPLQAKQFRIGDKRKNG